MQQDLEEEKNKAIIKDLEDKVENYEAALKKKDFVIQDLEIIVKEHEAALEKKDFVIHSMEGSLAEVQAENDRLNSELLKKSEKSEQEKKNLETSLKTEIEKNSNLQQSLKELQEKCLNFDNRCVQRLKDVFHSIGASSDKFTPSAENLPST
jgi:chromosome segregation ATPase